MKNYKYLASIVIFLMLGHVTGCGVYSFSGVSVNASTITVNTFFNDALGGPPDLSQRFTNSLQDYYQRNTGLTLLPDNGDLIVEGVITEYRLEPLGATQQSVGNRQVDTSADTKLTISIKVSYVNINDETFNFEGKTFTQFEPFNNEQNFTAIEDQLLDVIFEKLIIDIFNETVANW
ncbi:MAG: LPS assembly lipoprotein LptE [Candidatus Cyclobacteriaceae bacterium M2_1C_046]